MRVPSRGATCSCWYTARSPDWVRNALAAGHARLTIDGRELELTAPRLIAEDEAWPAIGDDVKRPPALLRISEFLRMDVATS